MIKKAMKLLTAAGVIVCMLMGMAGCGGSESEMTLESFISDNPEVGEEIDNQIESNDLCDISVDYDKNCCIVTMKYKETYEGNLVDQISEAIESQDEALAESCNESIKLIEDESGISGISFKVVFLNGDDTVLWEKEYTGE
ncbi:MAG: hypothetical protein MR991_07970 [Clostridiales bacterium]|nr:hypothetical protein [Clostridiales bacterium]MDD7034891.1 hypothetical protein [Bacillota bacterium]MDY2920348.1 hypothetical protein [Lentihominibacter sp.]